jgi:hypothetical protein
MFGRRGAYSPWRDCRRNTTGDPAGEQLVSLDEFIVIDDKMPFTEPRRGAMCAFAGMQAWGYPQVSASMRLPGRRQACPQTRGHRIVTGEKSI